jgi:hypothetical protein
MGGNYSSSFRRKRLFTMMHLVCMEKLSENIIIHVQYFIYQSVVE